MLIYLKFSCTNSKVLSLYVKILQIRPHGSAAIHSCMCFRYTVMHYFSGFVFSPGVLAGLVGLKADALGCRWLEALADLVVSAGCLRHKTGIVTFAAHMIFTALTCCLRQICHSYPALRCCRVFLPRPAARLQTIRVIRR
jgi:hypothetical protein